LSGGSQQGFDFLPQEGIACTLFIEEPKRASGVNSSAS